MLAPIRAPAPRLAPPPALDTARPPPPAPPSSPDAFIRGTATTTSASTVASTVARPKPSADTKLMQQQLNSWRADHNLPAIKEDGLLGPDTRRALADFQRTSGLRPDGLYGPAARARLTLENAPGFKLLGQDTQDHARRFMTSLGSDNQALERFGMFAANPAYQIHLPAFTSDGFSKLTSAGQKVVFDRILRDARKNPGEARNLTSLLTSPGMATITPGAVTKLVKAQLAHPADDRLEQSLTRMAGSDGFKALSARQQNHVAATLASYAGQRRELDNYTNVVSVLDNFTPDARRSILGSIELRPHLDEVSNNVLRLSGDPAFKRMDEATQLDLVQRVVSGPDYAHYAGNLVELQSALSVEDDRRIQQGLDPLPADLRDQLLGERYAENKLTPAQIANILTLAFAPGFEKHDAQVRELMLDVHAQRPDNAQLTTELATVAGEAWLQRQPRKARARIYDVDSAVP